MQDPVQLTAHAREVLGEILKHMGIDATIDMRDENERTTLDIHGPEAGLVIGKKGQTLEALQYLVSKIIHRQRRRAFGGARQADRHRQRGVSRAARGGAGRARRTALARRRSRRGGPSRSIR